jgi:hypothetical protein
MNTYAKRGLRGTPTETNEFKVTDCFTPRVSEIPSSTIADISEIEREQILAAVGSYQYDKNPSSNDSKFSKSSNDSKFSKSSNDSKFSKSSNDSKSSANLKRRGGKSRRRRASKKKSSSRRRRRRTSKK